MLTIQLTDNSIQTLTEKLPMTKLTSNGITIAMPSFTQRQDVTYSVQGAYLKPLPTATQYKYVDNLGRTSTWSLTMVGGVNSYSKSNPQVINLASIGSGYYIINVSGLTLSLPNYSIKNNNNITILANNYLNLVQTEDNLPIHTNDTEIVNLFNLGTTTLQPNKLYWMNFQVGNLAILCCGIITDGTVWKLICPQANGNTVGNYVYNWSSDGWSKSIGMGKYNV